MAFVELEIKDKKYKLEYNRDAIVMMEEMGLDIMNIGKKLYTSATVMILGALHKNHSDMRPNEASDLASEVIEEYGIKEITDVLSDLYMEVVNVAENHGKKLVIKRG